MFISLWISQYGKIMLDKLCFFICYYKVIHTVIHTNLQIKNHGVEAVVYICFL